ncbi:RHS repeat domain-containing protein [Kribbella sp. NPDC048928]|uniref:RHS repeat domain-containing protein n=1 Tax=Kribbella sp. NPDC048928 TaxID=3364111 RepID=UPI0037115915
MCSDTCSPADSGNTTSYEYDVRGNPTASVDPLGARTTTVYDGAGNQVKLTRPSGTSST